MAFSQGILTIALAKFAGDFFRRLSLRIESVEECVAYERVDLLNDTVRLSFTMERILECKLDVYITSLREFPRMTSLDMLVGTRNQSEFKLIPERSYTDSYVEDYVVWATRCLETYAYRELEGDFSHLGSAEDIAPQDTP